MATQYSENQSNFPLPCFSYPLPLSPNTYHYQSTLSNESNRPVSLGRLTLLVKADFPASRNDSPTQQHHDFSAWKNELLEIF